MKRELLYTAALEYLERGWSVIAVGPDKRPLGPWKWAQTRRAVPLQARAWWDVPNPPGIGIVCGEISNLLVFDVEVHGLAWCPALPSTRTAATQGGGRHFYFQWRPGIVRHSYSHEGRHVADVMTDGNYVLAPPTVGTKGTYRWLDEGPLAVAPPWLFTAPVAPLRIPPAEGRPSTGCIGTYPSRSERLMAITHQVVRNGGDVTAALTACLADPAGSKLLERSAARALRYVELMVAKVGLPAPGIAHLATVISISDGETAHGRRLTLQLRLEDGRKVRQGVTEQDSARWHAFKQALPFPASGRKVWVEIETRIWEGHQVLRVKKWARR